MDDESNDEIDNSLELLNEFFVSVKELSKKAKQASFKYNNHYVEMSYVRIGMALDYLHDILYHDSLEISEQKDLQ